MIKRRGTKPTIRQKTVFKEVLNGSSISKAMIKAGYSPTTASTTGKLTNTLGWKQLVDKFLSDDILVRRHIEQLNSSKHAKLYFDIDDDDDLIKRVCKQLGVELLYIKENKDKTGKTANVKAPDFFYRDLALDKAYKLKGRYPKEIPNPNSNNIIIVQVSSAGAEKYGIKPQEITVQDNVA